MTSVLRVVTVEPYAALLAGRHGHVGVGRSIPGSMPSMGYELPRADRRHAGYAAFAQPGHPVCGTSRTLNFGYIAVEKKVAAALPARRSPSAAAMAAK